ncbi:MAG: zinc-dependent alcohol dehydrogenase family protein [Gammaproteobacteria bacterium]
MKVAQLNAFGHPPEVVECIEVTDVGAPAADELVVAMEACPINPAEILLIQGRYASRPKLPARLGIEGVGRVLAVGADVHQIKAGERVISLDRANWAERCKLKAEQVVKLPAGIDVQQAAMLKVNPATALKMLEDYVDLKAGDWVIQNAANSGVGYCLIRLAKARGLRTINVVRRASLVESLQKMGADVVLVEGDDLGQRMRAATGGFDARLAIDAVGGRATLHLADCLAEGGIVVNYGLLSGEPCMIGAEQTIFRGITLTGFWLAKVMRGMSHVALEAMYQRLAERVIDGTLYVPVEATYPLEQVKQAVAHAAREGRDGKVLLTPTV